MNIKCIPKLEGGGFLSLNLKRPLISGSKKRNIQGFIFLTALFFSFLPKQMLAQCSEPQCQTNPSGNGPEPCDAKLYCSNNGSVTEGLIACTTAADTDGCGVEANAPVDPFTNTSLFVNQGVPTSCYINPNTNSQYTYVQWIKFATPPGVNTVKLQGVGQMDAWVVFYAGEEEDILPYQLTGCNTLSYVDGACSNMNQFKIWTNPAALIDDDFINVYYIALLYDAPSNGSINFKVKECEYVEICEPQINCPDSSPCLTTQQQVVDWYDSVAYGGCGEAVMVSANPSLANIGECTSSVVFTLVDMAGNPILNNGVAVSCTTSVNIDMAGPVITDIPDYTLACNGVWPSVSFDWTDNCGVGTPVLTSGTASAIAGAIQNEGSCLESRVYSVTVTDNCGNTSSQSVTISRPNDNQGPVITDIPDYTLACNGVWPSVSFDWTDNCGVGTPVLTSGTASAIAGAIQNEGSCLESRVYSVTVTDNCGNTSSQSVTISRHNDNQGPVITDIPDYTLACNGVWPSVSFDWTDNCGVGTPVLTSGTASAIAGAIQNEGSCLESRVYSVTITDNCGNTSSQSVTISRPNDNQGSVITDIPDYTLACNGVWPSVSFDWTDNCGVGTPVLTSGTASATAGAIQNEGSCLESRVYSVTVTGNCGNTSSQSVTISRPNDNQGPVIIDIPDYTLACNGVWPSVSFDWTDNCGVGTPVLTSGTASATAGAIQNEGSCLESRVYSVTVTDNCGNTSSQSVTISRPNDNQGPVITDIPDYTLACNGVWPSVSFDWTDNCGVGTPVLTSGTASATAGAIQNEGSCLESRVYSVTITGNCGNTSSQSVTISRPNDNQGPVIIDIPDYTLAYNGVWPSVFFDWTDNCGVGTPVLISGSAFATAGVIQNEGSCLESRVYSVTVTDNCGNASSQSVTISRPNDNLAPIPICDESTVVALNNLGFANVGAMVFDDGSTDNCGIVSYEVRRMASSCALETPFANSVEFTCCDVGEIIMVELKLTDVAGNMNSCMVEVEVQDKQNPTIICPPNKTIECGSDTSAVALGMALGLDNCGTSNITWVNLGTLDPTCGTGIISRVWTATDAQGQTTSCIQTIDVINSDPFSGNTDPNDPDDIQFPSDLTGVNAISCISYQNDPTLIDPSNTGEPILVGNISACSSVGTIIPTDLFLNMGIVGCSSVKIFRKWVVVDWCQAGSNPDLTQNGPGVWVHTQVIMVNDNEAPILLNPLSDLIIGVEANCKNIITLPQIAATNIDDCSDNVQVTVSSPNLTLNGFVSDSVGVGNYSAAYTLDDGCGNSAMHTISIIVEDDKMPTPVCNTGLSSTLPIVPVGASTITIPASAFVHSSTFDNCTDFGDLTFTIAFDSLNTNPLTNPPPTATELTFTCDDRGSNLVQIWVCDQAGNCDYCVTEIMVAGSVWACGLDPGPLAFVTGIIDNEEGEGIDEVEVNVNNSQFMGMTNSTGWYNLDGIPMYQNYNIKPRKNTTPLNGVTTYDIVKIKKHILGIELLDSPYKIIAGDVNGSGELTALDLAQIRNLILLNMNEFSNGVPSWRFIDANYVFSNPSDPLNEAFPEAVDVQNLETDLDEVNFIAIKVGDVTENATPNLLANESREKEGELIFKTQNSKVKKGEEISLVFETENEKDFLAWQFTLSFEQDLMEFIEVKKMENVYFGNSVLENGAITFSWDKTENAVLKTKLKWFEVRFIATEDLNIRDVINITSNHTSAIAYNSNGGEYHIVLQFEKELDEFENQAFALYPNSPNPFETSTFINFYLPEDDNIEITVFDITGKLLKTYNAFYSKGKQHFILGKETSFSKGVLYYRVKTSKHQASGKMILLP